MTKPSELNNFFFGTYTICLLYVILFLLDNGGKREENNLVIFAQMGV